MKFLIGATFAVLVACIFFSYQNMNEKLGQNPQSAEIQALEKRLAQLEAAERGTYPSASTPTYPTTPAYGENTLQAPPTTNPLEAQALEMQKQKEIEELKKQLAASEQKTETAEKKVEQAKAETSVFANEMADRSQPESARAARIAQALLMARVSTWLPDERLIQLKIERPENVNEGSILGIRRNSGIIGRIKVGTIELSEAVADPIPGSFIGEIDIREGDELIVPPVF